MEINLYLILILLFVLMYALPCFLVIALKNHPVWLKIFIFIWFIAYLATLFVGVTANIKIYSNKIGIYFNFNQPWFKLNFVFFGRGNLNFITNLAMMFPLGFFVYTFFKKSFSKTIIFSFVLSVLIELLQWVLPINRNTEILDVILNTASGLISAIYLWIMQKLNLIKK